MGKRRKRGTRKGFEAQGRYSPPERNGIGTYGTHRTAAMEDRRAERLELNKQSEPDRPDCRKFNEAYAVWVKEEEQ